MCGRLSILGEDMLRAYGNMLHHLRGNCAERACMRRPVPQEVPRNKYMTTLTANFVVIGLKNELRTAPLFPFALALLRQRECYDPRDKVYGYLGLAGHPYPEHLSPDYEDSVAGALEKAVWSMVRVMENLWPVTQVEISDTRNFEVASWIPTWSVVEDPDLSRWTAHRRAKDPEIHRARGNQPIGTATCRTGNRQTSRNSHRSGYAYRSSHPLVVDAS